VQVMSHRLTALGVLTQLHRREKILPARAAKHPGERAAVPLRTTRAAG
jgi:hypothetical protein